MKIQKEYFELLEKMSKMSQNALDSFSRISEAATIKSENLLRQQMEMFQLTSNPNKNPLAGAAEITDIVFKNRERLAQQQLDMMKLTIETGTDFLSEKGDNTTLENTMKAQRQFAENLSNKIFDTVKSNLEICFDTQSEINKVVKRNLATQQAEKIRQPESESTEPKKQAPPKKPVKDPSKK